MPSGRHQSRSSRSVSGAGVPWKNWRRGVVEDDVEDHLQPRSVQRADHPAKLIELATAVAR
jgi:hypothetical protein